MSFGYTPAKKRFFDGDLDLVNDTIRIALVMTNTTADTEEDSDFIGDVTTLDEYDGANYARQTLSGNTNTADTANDRAEFDANNATFTSLGAGTRQAQALLLFKFVTNDADSPLIAFIDTGGFPFDGNGGNVVIQWNAEGILQLT